MAHRIAKKAVRSHVDHQKTQQGPQSQMHHYQNNPTKNQNNVPRPIILSVDSIYMHQKSSFRKGLLAFPPPQSLFTSENVYDAGPDFVRPTSAYMLGNPKRTQFPFGAWITPFGSQKVCTVRVKSPLRCSRCKAYANAYFKFDGTKSSGTCNICGINFIIDGSVDPNNINSSELATQGIIDFVVQDKIFMRKRLDIVKIIIAIQIGHYMSDAGIIQTIIESAKSVIQNNQYENNIRIGIVLFNSEGITLFKLKNSQQWSQSPPRKYNIKYSSGMCCPLSDSQMLYDPNSQKQQLVYILDYLYQLSQDFYKNSKYSQHASNYPATVKSLLQNFTNQTGRIILFSHTTPRVGPYSIRPKNNEDNKHPLKPLGNEHYQLGRELVKAKVGVDMFIFSKQALASQQLATVHFMCSLTGGNLIYFLPYKAQQHSQILYYQIYSNLSRKYVYDVDFTTRVSNGLNIASFGAGDGIRQSRDVTLSMMNPSHSFIFTFEHEDKIPENSSAFFQFAMMYTNGSGERRLRIINYRYQITNKIELLHEACDYIAIANIILRQTVSKLLKGSQPLKLRQEAVSRLVSIIVQYAQEGSGKMRNSTFMAHPNFGPALAYIHSVINSRMFLNQIKSTSDWKISEIMKINTLNFYSFANVFYPKLYSLVPGDLIEGDGNIEQSAVLPPNLPLILESFKKQGVYLLFNSEFIIIFVMPNAPQQLLIEIFGTQNWDDIQANGLPQLQSPHNIRINIIIQEIRRRTTATNGIFTPIIVRTPKRKGPFNQLVNIYAKQDYPDFKYFNFLDTVHRNIQMKLK